MFLPIIATTHDVDKRFISFHHGMLPTSTSLSWGKAPYISSLLHPSYTRLLDFCMSMISRLTYTTHGGLQNHTLHAVAEKRHESQGTQHSMPAPSRRMFSRYFLFRRTHKEGSTCGHITVHDDIVPTSWENSRSCRLHRHI